MRREDEASRKLCWPTVVVPPAIRECVCFAYAMHKGELRPIGTAFFVGIPLGDTERFGCVVVTALHIVAKAREQEDDGRVHLRVNTTGGGVEFILVADSDWVVPDQSQEAIDVAVAVWPYGRDRFAFRFTTIDDAATPEVVESQVVGPGDEVFSRVFS